MKRIIVSLIVILFISGCAAIEIPSPELVINKPLGTDSVKVGMTKDQIKDLWGEPDDIYFEEEGELERAREVWTYRGRYAGVPVDAGYLSKTKYLYFDGKNVTKISDTKVSE